MWPSLSNSSAANSNLEHFLHNVTPNPPSHQDDDMNGEEKSEYYYRLEDLWRCYEEWSAYGAGTPIIISTGTGTTRNGENVVTQYYVPYLSALQLYTINASSSRGVDNESGSWSDDSIGSDKLSSNNSSRTNWDSDEYSNLDDQLGYPFLHYIDFVSPYSRAPFSDKMNELARENPQLMTLRSIDLSPACWMAVAWYPIYAIPSGKNEKVLSTCFLTYHTLSSAFQDDEEYGDKKGKHTYCSILAGKEHDAGGRISLSPFGLATYRMQADIWMDQQTLDIERTIDLYYAADSWLRQLKVYHPDFNFFTYT